MLLACSTSGPTSGVIGLVECRRLVNQSSPLPTRSYSLLSLLLTSGAISGFVGIFCFGQTTRQ